MNHVKKGTILNTGRTWFKKGFVPWNKGKKRPEMTGENHPRWKGFIKRKCPICGNEFIVPMWRVKDVGRGKFCSQSCKGKFFRGELGTHYKEGLPRCLDCGKQLTQYDAKYCFDHSYPDGENSRGWRGGITPINTLIRSSKEYKLWRESVFKRDNYSCVWCGQQGGYLEADHIKPFAYYPELRFAIDNGRTLCINCHRRTATYKGRSHK